MMRGYGFESEKVLYACGIVEDVYVPLLLLLLLLGSPWLLSCLSHIPFRYKSAYQIMAEAVAALEQRTRTSVRHSDDEFLPQ